MTGIWKFYNELFDIEPTDALNECMQVVPNIVTNYMNETLMASITVNEVERAVFSLGALSAPGPDGFNGLFYQKNWHTIKYDILKAIYVFFDTG